MSGTPSHPPFDEEAAAALSAGAGFLHATITEDMIGDLRAERESATDLDAIRAKGVTLRDVTISGHGGAEILLTVMTPVDHEPGGPGIYHIHGGGMIMSNRFTGADNVAEWAVRWGAVAVTVEYRLAPEHQDPIPVEDSYAGLVWMVHHAAELGFDAERLLVNGESAGGGLAAGVTLMARDRRGPEIAGTLLLYPMLDDRDVTPSSTELDGEGVWDHTSNVTGWTALLGDRRGRADVSNYAAPARETDLSRLPPVYLDCGSAEVFRDEDVAFASAIWAAGGRCELHVWPGGFHAYEKVAPAARISQGRKATRESWIGSIIG